MFRTRLFIAALLGVAVAATLNAQERKFELAFTKDKDGKYVPYYQETTTDLRQIIKVQGQDLTQIQKSTFWYKWTPGDAAPDPKLDAKDGPYVKMEQQVEGLAMEIDISGNPIKYSSKEEPTGPAGNPGLTDFFKKMKDVKLTAVIGKNYKVVDVQGKKEFIDALSTGSQQMKQLLEGAMTDDSLKQMVDPTYGIFPSDGAVKKKDEAWERKATLDLGPIGKYELTYKLKYLGPAADPAKDKIEIETVINFVPPPSPGQLLFQIKPGSKMTSDSAGSKGEIVYDPKTQRIESAVIRIKLKGDLIVAIGNTDTKVELTLEQTTTIKTQATSFLTTPAPMTPTPPVPPKK